MSSDRQPILQDHKKQGGKLIAPFNHLLRGDKYYISWRKYCIPEIFWIGLAQRQLGLEDATKTIIEISNTTRCIQGERANHTFAITSDFETLSDAEAQSLREKLSGLGELQRIQDTLHPLVAWYPECPLRRLFGDMIPDPSESDLEVLKSVLGELYYRSEPEAMMVQTTVVWLGISVGTIVISKDSGLSDLSKMVDYPNTETSRRLGSFVRATINAVQSPNAPFAASTDWCAYFWRRGVEISPCEFSDE